MVTDDPPPPPPTPPARHEPLGGRLWRRPRFWFLFGIPVGALLAFICGIVFLGGVRWGLARVETVSFCSGSCHEMQQPYQEYTQSIHYRNPYGVAATCGDCHVPKPFVARILRHAAASGELVQKMLGYIDTPAKYEQHRAQMAQEVWATLKADHSEECRSCHAFSAMDLSKQPVFAARAHTGAAAADSGKSCIDCHKGVAHKLPESS